MTLNLRNRLVPLFLMSLFLIFTCAEDEDDSVRERISLNDNWKFFKYASATDADHLIYDVRPQFEDDEDGKDADAKPTEARKITSDEKVLKPWILPTGNRFLVKEEDKYKRPQNEPFPDFPFIQSDFEDKDWKTVNLPYDWAIKDPFYEGWDAEVGGGMGRLPSPGIGWYRKEIEISKTDLEKQFFLEIEGAMSYAMVWLNGKIVGGWPYGYASWQVDLTPYIKEGENQLAIRVDNPPASSRWYPGGGIYRNVWLSKKNPVHVGQWGTNVSSKNVTENSAEVDLSLSIDNTSDKNAEISVENRVYELHANGEKGDEIIAEFETANLNVQAYSTVKSQSEISIQDPKLWGPPPTQKPNQYVVETKIYMGNGLIDEYDTPFGIRSLEFDRNDGLMVNGEKIYIKGVNLHHDLGALGAAFNSNAAERQLKLLKEMGVNAVRMAHNPPASGFLELTDKMGFLVVDEIFDVWERKKTPLDFHLIFPDWYEQDLRAFIRRDRNHPSVILWSYGNEVGEQYTGEEGAELSRELNQIVKEEDPTRSTTVSMNFSKPDMEFSKVPDVINLNYQGEGIRDTPAHAHLEGIRTDPLYGDFHKALPNKLILSSENAAALSTRGEFLLPVQPGISYPVTDSLGGDSKNKYVSDFGIYAVEFGSSPDKVFKAKDQHPFVGGGFVWSGWDYLGEPSPYYQARSSYFGIIDLAGFKKSRFYQYQARWRPDFKMAHIIPHWNWENRIGESIPVHVFSSADEAELFLNGKSLGRKEKREFEYRFRWEEVTYQPGKLEVVTYENGEEWARDTKETTGKASAIELISDKKILKPSGNDFAFITVNIVDYKGRIVPTSDASLEFEVLGAGEIVATDNGNPADLTSFASKKRKALNGKALVIIKSLDEDETKLTLKVTSQNLKSSEIEFEVSPL